MKMKQKFVLKGDKLFSLLYWGGEFIDTKRQFTTYKIKEIKRGRVYLYGGYAWSIPIDKIGIDFFTSKKELYKNKINAHEESLEEIDYEQIQPLKKEIAYLKRKLGELKENEV